MKKAFYGCLLLLAVAAFVTPALAAGDEEPGEGNWEFSGELRTRMEMLDNYFDFDGDVDDSVSFTGYRARAGATGEFEKNISARIELQNFGSWGDSFPLPQNSINVPWLQTLSIDGGFNDTQLYQAYVQVGNLLGSNLTLRVGRQEHTLGRELHLGDSDYYNGQTFDGLRGMWQAETWELDFFHYTLTDRSVLPNSVLSGGVPINGGSDDVTLSGLTANFDINDNSYVEPYILFYRDGNEGLTTDLFYIFQPNGGIAKFNHFTVGALYDRPHQEGDAWEWNVEFALQKGDWGPAGMTDINAWIFEGGLGYHWGNGHAVKGGAISMSGLGSDVSDIEGFMPLFMDVNAHNRMGHSDFFGSRPPVGITSFFVAYEGERGNHEYSFSFHQHAVTDVPPGVNDDMGNEFNAFYHYNVSSNLKTSVSLALLQPDDFLTGGGAAMDDGVMRFTVGSRLRF